MDTKQAQFASLTQAINLENKRISGLGERAEFSKLITMMEEHNDLAEELGHDPIFTDDIEKLKDLGLRIKHYRKTGFFSAKEVAGDRPETTLKLLS